MVRETVYDGISLKELREIKKLDKNYKIVLVPSFDGWRYAIKNQYGTTLIFTRKSLKLLKGGQIK